MRKANYGFVECIQNVIYIIKSVFFFKKARLIRFPVVIRGKKYIDFGNRLTTGRYCRLEVNGVHSQKCLIFGNNDNIGDYVSIRCAEHIKLGDNVLIGSHVLIIDNSHGSYSGVRQDSPAVPPNSRSLVSSSIEIGDNVWIGDGVVIQKGVNIGKGSIIAANAVIVKDVPSETIVAGVPAEIIRVYDSKDKIWKKVKRELR